MKLGELLDILFEWKYSKANTWVTRVASDVYVDLCIIANKEEVQSPEVKLASFRPDAIRFLLSKLIFLDAGFDFSVKHAENCITPTMISQHSIIVNCVSELEKQIFDTKGKMELFHHIKKLVKAMYYIKHYVAEDCIKEIGYPVNIAIGYFERQLCDLMKLDDSPHESRKRTLDYTDDENTRKLFKKDEEDMEQ